MSSDLKKKIKNGGSDCNNRENNSDKIDLLAVSAKFCHDITTPLITVKMYAHALNERLGQSRDVVSDDSQNLIASSADLIVENVEIIQELLRQFRVQLESTSSVEDDQCNSGLSAAELSDKNIESQYHFDRALSILIVDDEVIYHEIALAVLPSFHSVTCASSGRKALELCMENEYDLILMDLEMPAMSGCMVVKKLHDVIDNVPLIIGLSNMPVITQKDELIELGISGFLEKPLKLDQLNYLLIRNLF